MLRFQRWKLKWLLIVLPICQSLPLFGQSTSTSKSDSLTAVNEYVHNSRAILDSLSHYEFLKIRTGQLRTDLKDSQVEKFGLRLQLVRVNTSLDSCRRSTAPLVEQLDKTQARLKASRTENWIWRGVGLLTLVKATTQLLSVFK